LRSIATCPLGNWSWETLPLHNFCIPTGVRWGDLELAWTWSRHLGIYFHPMNGADDEQNAKQ